MLTIELHWERARSAPKSETINFNLQQLEWISLEEMTFFFGWFQYLFDNGKKFKVNLPSQNKENFRAYRRLCSLWHRWHIFSFVPKNNQGKYRYEDYFNITTSIATLMEEEDKKDEIRSHFDDKYWHKIVPFFTLNTDYDDSIENLREVLSQELDGVFNLEKRVEILLNEETAYSSFQNKILSQIITTELFLNCVHHAFPSKGDKHRKCFMAIALNNKVDYSFILQQKELQGEKKSLAEVIRETERKIDRRLKIERCSEELEFYYSNEKPRNETLIEFTFLDFGKGIPESLRAAFEVTKEKHPEIIENLTSTFFNCNVDTQILEYAFLLDTSQNPFIDNIEMQEYIPRGLFFVIEMVKRYNGMIIARSNRGKIVYNFSKDTLSPNSYTRFSAQDGHLPNFPGTMLSIYIPAANNPTINAVQTTKIYREESEHQGKNIDNKTIFHIPLYEIEEEIVSKYSNNISSSSFINHFFNEINKILKKANENSALVIFDFFLCQKYIFEEKLYYYLINTPLINETMNCMLLFPPDRKKLEVFKVRTRKDTTPIFRPIPCVFSESDIEWIGLNSLENEDKLNKYLFYKEQPTYSGIDFIKYKQLHGNMFNIDPKTNVRITINSLSDILDHIFINQVQIELEASLLTGLNDILLND